MKSRLWFITLYFVYWVVFFLIAKVIFLLYHLHHTSQFGLGTIAGIFYHGLALDLSATGYLVLFPLTLIFLTCYLRGKVLSVIIRIYTLVLLVVNIIMTLSDMELYKYWGTRLDNTALRFINTPKEMLASTTWLALTLFSISLVAFTLLYYWPYKKFLNKLLLHSKKPGWKGMLAFLLLYLPVVLIIRGGTGLSPINVSRAYFHKELFWIQTE